jgi:hypothetical protein
MHIMNERHDAGHVGRVEAHRLDGFIDAAFAFAVSVLAIAGAEAPHSLHDSVAGPVPHSRLCVQLRNAADLLAPPRALARSLPHCTMASASRSA